MFGAYQAGAWKALAGRLHPNAVIGSSAGAINAWAIAGGIDPDDLTRFWLEAGTAEIPVLAPGRRGSFSGRALHEHMRRLCERFRPKIEVAIVAVDLKRMRPRLFRNDEVTWRHLAASCAVPFWYPQIRLDERWYTDGGVLAPLPLWAAPQVGAASALGIDVLTSAPPAAVRAAVRALRSLAPKTPKLPEGFPVVRIEPSERLGSLRDAIFWKRENIERWIRLGEADALKADAIQCA
jgi:NTE family protein